MKCKILKCNKKVLAKGLCSIHYSKRRRDILKFGRVLIDDEWHVASKEFSDIVKQINKNISRK